MDNTPTALFESYEADFKHTLEGLKEKLETAGTGGECFSVNLETTCLAEHSVDRTAKVCGSEGVD